MKSYKDFKIGTKLYSGFGAVLVLLAVVAFMSYDNLMNTEKGFINLIHGDISIEIQNANIDRYMLQARRNEKDFLLRKEIKHLEKVDKAVANLKKEANLLLELEQKAGNQQGIKDANLILEYADQYLDGFHNIVKEYQTIGLDHASGLQGQFRVAASELAGIINNANEQLLQINLLTIRKEEKDYLLLGDEKYIKRTIDKLATLQLNAYASGLSAEDKIAVKITTQKYEKGFLKLVEKNIAIEKNMIVMIDAANKLEPIVNEGYYSAKENATAKEILTIETAESNAQIPIWISAIALLMGGFIAFYVARIISRPISDIATIAELISTGDIDHTIKVNSKDETGQLAQSFQNLINYMKELAEAANQIASNNLTIDVKPKSDKDVLGSSFTKMISNLTGVVHQLNATAEQVVSAAT